MSMDLYWGIGWLLGTIVTSMGFAWLVLSDKGFISHDGAPMFMLPILMGAAFLLLWPVAMPVGLTTVFAYRVKARRKQRALDDAETNRILAENP